MFLEKKLPVRFGQWEAARRWWPGAPAGHGLRPALLPRAHGASREEEPRLPSAVCRLPRRPAGQPSSTAASSPDTVAGCSTGWRDETGGRGAAGRGVADWWQTAGRGGLRALGAGGGGAQGRGRAVAGRGTNGSVGLEGFALRPEGDGLMERGDELLG